MSRGLLLGVVVMASLLTPAAALAADQPPSDLHQVGDHWTAWDPPTSFPEGTEVYTIVPGDTLWDLAGRFYQNNYLWPQIWERNQYILDAHWIYPGDPLVTGLAVAPVETGELEDASVPASPGVAVGETAPEEQHNVQTFAQAAGPPVPLGTEDDIYCSGYIGPAEEEFGYAVVGSEFESLTPKFGLGRATRTRFGPIQTVKNRLYIGDVVYIDGGREAGLAPGALFTAVEPGELVEHPLTGEEVGRYYGYQARVRILSVQDTTAIAEIVQSCRPIGIGSRLKPFVPEPVPLGRRTVLRPINAPTSAAALEQAPTIVLSDEGQTSLGEDHVVHVDLGASSDATPGDIYTIWRLQTRPELPPMPVGELAVLSIHERTAVAKIIHSRHTIHLGDRLERK